MQKFYFHALTKNGKKISGTIFAENSGDARKKISEKGFAILEVADFSARKNSGKKIFEFFGVDAENQQIHGKIEADDEFSAYKKLRLEYNFSISSIFDDELPVTEKQKLKLQKINPALEKKFLNETKNLTDQKNAEKLAQKIFEMRAKKDEKIRAKTLKTIRKIQFLVQKNSDFFSEKTQQEITNKINLMLRLRQSSSISRVQKIVKKFLGQIGEIAVFSRENLDDSQKKNIDSREKFFRDFVKKLLNNFETKISQIEFDKISIDSEKIKKRIAQLEITKKIFSFFYLIFAVLALIFSVFWIFSGIKFLFNLDRAKILFFAQSENFLFLNFLIFLVVIFFSFFFLQKRPLHFFQKIFVSIFAIFSIFFWSIFFPQIFFWTRNFVI